MRPRPVQPGSPDPRAAGRESRRYLLLSATMGAGHDAVAAVLGDRLTATGHQISRADVLDLLPAGLGRVIRSFYHAVIRHLPALYAGIYQVFFRDGAEPRPSATPLRPGRRRPARADRPVPARCRRTGLPPGGPGDRPAPRPRGPGGAERGGGDRLRRPPAVAPPRQRPVPVPGPADRRPGRAVGRPARGGVRPAGGRAVHPAAVTRPRGVVARVPRRPGQARDPVVHRRLGRRHPRRADRPPARRSGYRPVVLCGENERLRHEVLASPVPSSWAGSTTCPSHGCRGRAHRRRGQQARCRPWPPACRRRLPAHPRARRRGRPADGGPGPDRLRPRARAASPSPVGR